MKHGIDLSHLPSDWSVVELGDHLQRIANGLTATQEQEQPGIPVSRIETISTGTINFDRVRYVRDIDEKTKRNFLLQYGDILFSHINSDLHLGKTAIYCSNKPLLHGMNLLVLRTQKETLDSYYLHYLLNYYRREGRFIEIAQHAVNQSSLNQQKIKTILVPLAPIEEQKRIVAEIEKQFSRLDEAVANLKRVKANLKRYKAAVLNAAVEGKLTEEWRKQHPNVEPASKLLERILAERRAKWNGGRKYKEPAKSDTSNRWPLPTGWDWTSPDQLSQADTNAICAGPFGTIFKAKDFRPVGVAIIFRRHVAPGRYLRHKPGFMDEKKWKGLFEPYSVFGGELLVTKLGEPPGVCAIYPV
jgi:type I restriction enzyme S subunit